MRVVPVGLRDVVAVDARHRLCLLAEEAVALDAPQHDGRKHQQEQQAHHDLGMLADHFEHAWTLWGQKEKANSPFALLGWWVLTVSNRRPTPCKGAALPTELSTPPGRKSVQGILQCLAGTELGHLGGLDFNRSAGARIAPAARGALADGEGAETHQRHRAAFFQRRLDGADGGLPAVRSRWHPRRHRAGSTPCPTSAPRSAATA